MFSRVLVATLEAQIVRTPIIAQLSLTAEIIYSGTRRCWCSWNKRRWWRATCWCRSLSWTRSLQLFLLYPGQYRRPSDARRSLGPNKCSNLLLQSQHKLCDEELDTQRRIKSQQVVHVLLELQSVLHHRAQLTQLK
jgi:hypothetical protein